MVFKSKVNRNVIDCTYTHTPARALAHTHTRTRTHARTYTHARAHTHARTHTHSHTHAHARTHAHTYTHAHTQAHTHTRTLQAAFTTTYRSTIQSLTVKTGRPKDDSPTEAFTVSTPQHRPCFVLFLALRSMVRNVNKRSHWRDFISGWDVTQCRQILTQVSWGLIRRGNRAGRHKIVDPFSLNH